MWGASPYCVDPRGPPNCTPGPARHLQTQAWGAGWAFPPASSPTPCWDPQHPLCPSQAKRGPAGCIPRLPGDACSLAMEALPPPSSWTGPAPSMPLCLSGLFPPGPWKPPCRLVGAAPSAPLLSGCSFQVVPELPHIATPNQEATPHNSHMCHEDPLLSGPGGALWLAVRGAQPSLKAWTSSALD